METVTFSQIGIFVACLIVILGAAVAFKLLQRDPPLHKEYMTRDQHAELKREIEKLDNERRVSVARLHEETKALSVDIAALKNETGHQTRQLMLLDQKIESLPAKIAVLLKR